MEAVALLLCRPIVKIFNRVDQLVGEFDLPGSVIA